MHRKHTYTHKRIIRHRVKGAVLLKKPSKYVHGRVVEVEGLGSEGSCCEWMMEKRHQDQ